MRTVCKILFVPLWLLLAILRLVFSSLQAQRRLYS